MTVLVRIALGTARRPRPERSSRSFLPRRHRARGGGPRRVGPRERVAVPARRAARPGSRRSSSRSPSATRARRAPPSRSGRRRSSPSRSRSSSSTSRSSRASSSARRSSSRAGSCSRASARDPSTSGALGLLFALRATIAFATRDSLVRWLGTEATDVEPGLAAFATHAHRHRRVVGFVLAGRAPAHARGARCSFPPGSATASRTSSSSRRSTAAASRSSRRSSRPSRSGA